MCSVEADLDDGVLGTPDLQLQFTYFVEHNVCKVLTYELVDSLLQIHTELRPVCVPKLPTHQLASRRTHMADAAQP
jgi:hypothetical protein